MATHTLHDCYREIISASNARAGQRGQGIDYAAMYAREGLRMPDAVSKAELTDESKTQALYVRTNLSGWRGDKAKLVRTQIDKILKGR